MIAQPSPYIVLVATLLINALSFCSAEKAYCVTSNVTSCSSCPHNSTHCTTLSEYAQEAELYFTSNTTMVFLPGDHVLDTNITVANAAGLTLRGESSSGNRATVVCSGSVGLSFTSMKKVKVDSLAFTFCNRNYSYYRHEVSYFTLLLQSTQYAELINCSFHDNLGTALVTNNTSVILAGNNFTHNQCQSSVCEGGGGVMALNSKLTFTGNTTFHDNSATSVYGGGAIYVSRNAVLSFSGTTNLISNSADGDGGAIYAYDAVLNFNGNSNFINNSANGGGSGGASYSTVLNFSGTNGFINNSVDNGGGGATLLFNGTIYFTNY